MQNAKDTFYELLRRRLTLLNPERTVVARALTRPGVLVDENEMQASALLPDCFHLLWTAGNADAQGALPAVAQACEVSYSTAGTPQNGGLDRGRLLSAMDGELLAALNTYPRYARKNDFSALADGGGVQSLGTNIWWGDAVFGLVKIDRDRIVRTATVEVMSYQEAGEL